MDNFESTAYPVPGLEDRCPDGWFYTGTGYSSPGSFHLGAEVNWNLSTPAAVDLLSSNASSPG
jgi:hypothetical protein